MTDDDALVDTATELFRQADADEAFATLERLLTRIPCHHRALPTYCYHVVTLRGDERHFFLLRDFAASAPPDSDARRYLARLHQEAPLRRSLPAPDDVSLRALAAALYPPDGSMPTATHLELPISPTEPPSTRLAVDLALTARGITHSWRPVEDPRTSDFAGGATSQGESPVWRFESSPPRPNVPPPDLGTAEMVYSVASGPYHLDEWWDFGRTLARSLGPASLPSLLGTMVHFDADMPYPRPSWRWIQAVQVVAALTIAHLETGWEGPGKAALVALARGPADWTVDAAVLALCQVADELADAKPTVDGLLWGLFERLESGGSHCNATFLRHALLRLRPLADAHRRRRVEALFDGSNVC